MYQETGTTLFYIMFTIMAFGIFFLIILWPIITFMTPKKLINNYFKEPYFNRNELQLMNSFPLSLYRTAIFGWVIIFPFLDKRRQIKHCKEVMPIWFKICLYMLCLYTILLLSSTTVIMAILFTVPIK